MAHEITEMDGIVSSNNIVPWHGIGTVFADYPSKEEAYNAAFGWEPVEETMYRRIPSITPEGELIETYEEVTCDKLISRSDNGYVLGTANSGRGMVSNMELFDIAEALEAEARGDSPLRIETAGSLRGGEKVWLLVRLEEGIKIKNDVRGETIPFFALQNGHTRSGGAFKGQAVFTRLICANTVRAADLEAKKRGTEFSFRHTGKIGDRIEEAKQALIFWKQGVAEYQEMMEHLYSIKVDDLTKEDFIAMFVPEPVTGNLISDRVKNNILNARQQMRDIINGSTSEGFLSAGTLLGAGVEWSQHYKRTRGADEIARNENLFSRAYLDESKLTQGAMRIIKELVTV